MSKEAERRDLHNMDLMEADPEIGTILNEDLQRQRRRIILVPSENPAPYSVIQAEASPAMNKYAEGYPNNPLFPKPGFYYPGCDKLGEAEIIAVKRAKELFGVEHANVQPHSGTQANITVYFAAGLKPGDKILSMRLDHGGHLSHGNPVNISGKLFNIVFYGVRKDTEMIDMDEVEALAKEHRPKIIVVGASAYSRILDFEAFASIAHENGASLLADIAHIGGLVAAGVHPSPVPHADYITVTFQKTTRGPRGGMILCRKEFAKAVDSNMFPGQQGGPLMHVIAAKAVALKMAMTEEFKADQRMTVLNTRAIAETIAARGYRIVSGGTDNHLFLVDVGEKGLNGMEAQNALEVCDIDANRNGIPYDTRPPRIASGVRGGGATITTRGMGLAESDAIGNLIADVLDERIGLGRLDEEVNLIEANPKFVEDTKRRVHEITARFPIYEKMDRGFLS